MVRLIQLILLAQPLRLRLLVINATISRIWDLGGTPDTIMCDAATKQTISSSAVGGAVVADAVGKMLVLRTVL